VNPVFHDSGEICDEILAKAETAFRLLSKEESDDIISKFPKFPGCQRTVQGSSIPSRTLQPQRRHQETQKITADAFEIQVAKEDSRLFRCVLEGDISNQNNYLFIPYSLRSNNSAVYAQLLGKQNGYMQNQHNILLAGITDALITQALTKQEENKAFREMLQDQPGAYRVDPTW
jgi:hypothetical protein